MAIWIKTQDGFLEFCKRIGISFEHVCSYDGDIKIVLGFYSEERAKEVMQMIQEHINKLEYFRATGHISEAVPAVFEMPKE